MQSVRQRLAGQTTKVLPEVLPETLKHAGELQFAQLRNQEAQFQLTYADSLLARENLDAALRYVAAALYTTGPGCCSPCHANLCMRDMHFAPVGFAMSILAVSSAHVVFMLPVHIPLH